LPPPCVTFFTDVAGFAQTEPLNGCFTAAPLPSAGPKSDRSFPPLRVSALFPDPFRPTSLPPPDADAQDILWR
jgi:hypothetical protein